MGKKEPGVSLEGSVQVLRRTWYTLSFRRLIFSAVEHKLWGGGEAGQKQKIQCHILLSSFTFFLSFFSSLSLFFFLPTLR